jgi:hypothetical protein
MGHKLLTPHEEQDKETSVANKPETVSNVEMDPENRHCSGSKFP